MQGRRIDTSQLHDIRMSLHAGDQILLSGTVYTARDAAHQRLCRLLGDGEPLPFSLQGACIYYAGPTPTKPGQVVGSCGPTTSGRMDPYTPQLLEHGLCGMIGKGPRSQTVRQCIQKHKAVYFCAVGGLGALAARCVVKNEEIAFFDLGCESIKQMQFLNFPMVVAMDVFGGSLFSGT